MDENDHIAWRVLSKHFDQGRIGDLISAGRAFPGHARPDLLEALSRSLEPYGVRLLGLLQRNPFRPLALSSLATQDNHDAVRVGPIQYHEIDVGEDQPLSCLDNGLWLFKIEDIAIAVVMSKYQAGETRSLVRVEVGFLPSPEGNSFARSLLSILSDAVRVSRTFRGKVLSFEQRDSYAGLASEMNIYRVPQVKRDEVILDPDTMARLDRNIFEFHRIRTELKSFGQSVRKGILLYGPPGTGKTHIIRYVSSNLPDHTTIIITADQVKALATYMDLARTLQPSIVVIEDVDLIGKSRDQNNPGTEVLLNQLLNEMDGLKQDAEILFILTTNDPGRIESALASRPGRIDEAIEIGLPDANSRRRLIELYGRAVTIAPDAIDAAVRDTEGGSAAFMKEFTRRMVQNSIVRGEGGRIVVSDVMEVLEDLGGTGSGLARRLLGAPG